MFCAFFAVVDSSQRVAIVPGFVVDSSHPLSASDTDLPDGYMFSDDVGGTASPHGRFTVA